MRRAWKRRAVALTHTDEAELEDDFYAAWEALDLTRAKANGREQLKRYAANTF